MTKLRTSFYIVIISEWLSQNSSQSREAGRHLSKISFLGQAILERRVKEKNVKSGRHFEESAPAASQNAYRRQQSH